MIKKKVVSGVQATGDLHLGNYLGAIKGWTQMQDDYECFFFLADLHAITIDRMPEELTRSTIEVAAAFFACGLDPEKSTIFVQSHVPAHTELAWILNCVTPMGWLNRMTQFKDKAGKDKEGASTGLFTYPVLQAADVLLYHPHLVPVGEDQKQHIELIRDIAGVVNRKFDKDIFTLPQPMIIKEAARIKSLRDGTKKMSKSDPADASRINLSDSKEVIYQKFKRAKTDSITEITYDPEVRPEISNLLTIFASLSGQNVTHIVESYRDSGFAKFKEDLAELASETISPITNRYNELLKDPGELLNMLQKGSRKANELATQTISKIKKEFGFFI